MTFTTERRRDRGDGSPMATLVRLPALRVLAEFPVPVLAIAHDGTILFANTAFGQMLGYSRDDAQSLAFDDVFEAAVRPDGVVPAIRQQAGSLVRLKHAEGATIRAVMSQSALQRFDDQVALITFQDMSERLWLEGR